MSFRYPLLAAFTLVYLSGSSAAKADTDTITVWFDENGNSLFQDFTTGLMQLNRYPADNELDPLNRPSGLKPLVYHFPGSNFVSGDIKLSESVGVLSDVIRFTPDLATGNGLLVFYSDCDPTCDASADVGVPTSFQLNPLFFSETGTDSFNGLFQYTPGSGDPGFVSGAIVTYNFVSDGTFVPEPRGAAQLFVGLIMMLLVKYFSLKRYGGKRATHLEPQLARSVP
jgi:hypothetical protein